MSFTTTTNTSRLTLQQTLGDYEIHVTGAPQESQPKATPNSSTTQGITRNPASWPREYHRIPPRRPVNRELDWSQRPLGANLGEMVFLNIMFSGVSLNAVSVFENNVDVGETNGDRG